MIRICAPHRHFAPARGVLQPQWPAILRCVFALAACLGSDGAWSACSASADSVNFGSYDTLSDADVDGVGYIAVTCDSGVPYSIALSTGAGSYATRTMTSGADLLHYNLYTGPAHSVVWGDGAGATGAVAGTGTGNASNVAVHGRMPAHQNVHAGSYADSVVVTVNF